MGSAAPDARWEAEPMAKDESRVKVTLHLPERLTKDAKIYAVEHDLDLQDVVADALRAFLAKKGGR
jgi:hypothetical protein